MMVTRRRADAPLLVMLLIRPLLVTLLLLSLLPRSDAFLHHQPLPAATSSSRGVRAQTHRQVQMQMHVQMPMPEMPVHTPALRPFQPVADAPADAMPLVDHDRVRAHGRHVCLDYTGFRVDAREGAEATLAAIRAAVGESGVREVHSRVVVLGEDGLSPPGFTGVCLVDESHVTAHCYSDRGWLAIDVFTCGAHPPEVGRCCDWASIV